jgi:aminoglycoside 6'-N-acetyltransferase I
MNTPLQIAPVSDPAKAPYSLLLLADPSVEHINAYLNEGSCYLAYLQESVVGVMILSETAPGEIEIKNIAIREDFQGRGFGRQLLHYAETISRQKGYARLLIGTGNSSIGQLALYQKAGFEMKRIEHNFFLEQYEAPIYENGIQCKHKIVLEKLLPL